MLPLPTLYGEVVRAPQDELRTYTAAMLQLRRSITCRGSRNCFLAGGPKALTPAPVAAKTPRFRHRLGAAGSPSPGPGADHVDAQAGSLQHSSNAADIAAPEQLDPSVSALHAGEITGQRQSVDNKEEVAGDAEPEEEQEFVEVEVTTEVEEEVQEQVFSPREALQSAGTYLTMNNVGRVITGAGVAVLLATLAIAVYRVYERANTAQAKRRRLVERNKQLVTELSKYLPDKRDTLTSNVIRGLRGATGFTGVEVFRKYLWYLLRERKFDHEAVQDMLALKAAAGLSDADVAEALRTRAQKVYEAYGTLMLNTEGFSTAGLERRITCKLLFQKLLFLSESQGLVAQDSEAARSIDLRTIFGATEEDLNKIRLVSLFDVDLEKAFSQGGKIPDTESDEEDRGGR